MPESPIGMSDLDDLFAQVRAASTDGRVRPHFLFNVLNIIARLIDAGRSADATRTVMALANLLRYGFEPLDALTPLQDELRVVHAYATIQKFRFGDRLTLEISIPPDLMGASIPPRSVQILVENAFEAIESKVGQGRVIVAATAENNCLMIEVTDNGIGTGVTTAQMCTVHTGLVHQFGTAAGLTVDRVDGRGTIARITIPLEVRRSDS